MSLLSSTRTMVVGTIASRVTGFLRTAVLAAVLGVQGVAVAFNVANTAPNIIYDLLLGGVLSSTVVPLLVRAAKDPDGGEAYTQRLLSLTLVALGAASALLVLLAPQLVDLYASSKVSEADRHLAVVFARFFLPQVLFYGAGAVLSAYLNTRDSFSRPMWAPVLNNLVVIVTGLVFLLVPGPAELTSGTITATQIGVLGVGVTLGIVAQTVALIPALHAVGFRFRLRLDLRGAGLGPAVRLARWTLLFVVCNQLAFLVVVRLATGSSALSGDRGYPSYVYAYLLWQLPHAVVAVSLITALLPAMSRAAADGQTAVLRSQLDRGMRLTAAVLIPAAIGYLVLGRAVATVVFAHGATTTDQARFIGLLLGVFALGLVPFSAYQLQLRAFYALQDTRTPTLINLAVNATLVVADLTLYAVLPADLKVVGLAAGQSVSYLVGIAVCSAVLARRVPRDPQSHVTRTAVRCLVAALPAALVAALAGWACTALLGTGPVGALATLASGGAALGLGYVLAARRLRVAEVAQLTDPVLRRLSRTP